MDGFSPRSAAALGALLLAVLGGSAWWLSAGTPPVATLGALSRPPCAIDAAEITVQRGTSHGLDTRQLPAADVAALHDCLCAALPIREVPLDLPILKTVTLLEVRGADGAQRNFQILAENYLKGRKQVHVVACPWPFPL